MGYTLCLSSIKDKYLFCLLSKITIVRDVYMKAQLKQNKIRVGEVLPHALTFLVVFVTFTCEFSTVVEGFIKKELTISSAAFFLYIGTLVSLSVNELVYESIEKSNPKTHRAIVWLSVGGVILSLFAGLIMASSSWWNEYPDIKFWFFHILRCIVVLAYAALCWPCLNKAIVIWNETEESDEVRLDSGEKPSDFDINDNKSEKGA